MINYCGHFDPWTRLKQLIKKLYKIDLEVTSTSGLSFRHQSLRMTSKVDCSASQICARPTVEKLSFCVLLSKAELNVNNY